MKIEIIKSLTKSFESVSKKTDLGIEFLAGQRLTTFAGVYRLAEFFTSYKSSQSIL